MKNWRIRPQFSSACRMISSAVQPFSSILAASSTTRPSPNEAPQVFSTRIMRSGYSPRSSSAISSALQQVPLMPPEMAMYSTSSPSLRALSMVSRIRAGLTSEVLTSAPFRMAS